MPEVNEMIRELVQMVENELGTSLPPDSSRRLEEALCRQYGGERVYVPKLPKLVNQVRITALGTGKATMELAGALGVTPRRVRQLLRGK